MMRHHHMPDTMGPDINQSLARLVNVAEKMLPDLAMVEHSAQEITEQEWVKLGIDPREVDTIAEEVEAIAKQVTQLANAA